MKKIFFLYLAFPLFAFLPHPLQAVEKAPSVPVFVSQDQEPQMDINFLRIVFREHFEHIVPLFVHPDALPNLLRAGFKEIEIIRLLKSHLSPHDFAPPQVDSLKKLVQSLIDFKQDHVRRVDINLLRIVFREHFEHIVPLLVHPDALPNLFRAGFKEIEIIRLLNSHLRPHDFVPPQVEELKQLIQTLINFSSKRYIDANGHLDTDLERLTKANVAADKICILLRNHQENFPHFVEYLVWLFVRQDEHGQTKFSEFYEKKKKEHWETPLDADRQFFENFSETAQRVYILTNQEFRERRARMRIKQELPHSLDLPRKRPKASLQQETLL